MDDSAWDEIMESLAGTEPSATEDAATSAAMAPEEASPPNQDSTVPPPEATAPTETAAPVAESEPAPVSPPEPEASAPPAEPPDWRAAPEAQALIEKAKRWELIEQRAEETRRLQAQQQIVSRVQELADGDADRHQQLTGLLAEVATPLRQVAVQEAERATASEKLASALLIAMDAVLTDEQKQQILAEHQTLMGVEGVETMQRLAYGKRDAARQYSAQMAAKDARIAELERQIAAQQEIAQREATGADAVDGGGGSNTPPDLRTQLEQAEDMDAYFAAMFGRAA